MTKRILMVSADGHAGPRDIEEYRPYFEQKYEPWIDTLKEENKAYVSFFMSLATFPDEVLEVVDADRAIRSDGLSGAYDPQRRLVEMDREGIAAELVFSGIQTSTTMFYGPSNDSYPVEVRAAGGRAYHRWLADYLSAGHGRLIGVAQSGPCHNMDETVAELRWVADHGFRSVSAPGLVADPTLPPLYDEHFEPFWKTCSELGLVVSVHAGHGMAQGALMDFVRRLAAASTPEEVQHALTAGEQAGSPFAPTLVPARALYSAMLGGVFDRYPDLRVAATEVRADWVPATLALLDRRFAAEGTPMKKKPSEYWASNCFAGLSSIKESEVRLRHEIGIDRIMFGRDYPHSEGTWPNTWDWLRDALRGVPEDEIRALLGRNAVGCYQLDESALGAIADQIGPRPEEIMRDEPCVDPRIVAHFGQRGGYHNSFEVIDDEALNALVSQDLAGTAHL